MTIEEQNIDHGLKLEEALSEFKEIVLETKRESFINKWINIIIPTLISSIIGMCAFFAAFNLSEYKIGVLMQERIEIKESIKMIETKMAGDDIAEGLNLIFKDYTNKRIDEICQEIDILKQSLNKINTEHHTNKDSLLYRIVELEKLLIELRDKKDIHYYKD